MEDSIPEVSLALTEGQEGELVSTMPPCGSSISGQVSPCNTKAHLEVPKPNITVHEQKREKSHSLPLQYKCLPHCNTSGTNRKGSVSLQLHRFKASMGQGFTPSEGIQWYIYKSYQYAASVSSETQISSQSFLMKLESTNLSPEIF